MIRVTIYNEYVQEQMERRRFSFLGDCSEEDQKRWAKCAEEIRRAHPAGSIHANLRQLLEECEEIQVRRDRLKCLAV